MVDKIRGKEGAVLARLARYKDFEIRFVGGRGGLLLLRRYSD